MSDAPPNLNFAWARVLLQHLVRCGVTSIWICPGSRSTPLALAALESGATCTVHFDERGAGFAALGAARVTGHPAVVITTSGSAVANLWPAVSEASVDGVPLIMLTADRPPELRDTGANQALDQIKLFGDYVRWHIDLPCPDPVISPAFVRGVAEQAVARASSGWRGPVHVNQMFREPLAPAPDGVDTAAWLERDGAGAMTRWVTPPPAVIPDAERGEIMRMVSRAKRGVVVAGALPDAASARATLSLAKRLGWPLLPDIRSGLRLTRPGAHGPIAMVDQILLSPRAVESLRPDAVVQVGSRLVSKRLQQWLDAAGAPVIHLDEQPVRLDPATRPGWRIVAPVVQGLRLLATARMTGKTARWMKRWRAADAAANGAWSDWMAATDAVSEPAIADSVSRLLPRGHRLMLASSMPVRDMDMYGAPVRGVGRVYVNRGVSGIDGTLATAAGIAVAGGSPVTVITGDLAALHDLNSLALIARSPVPVTVVVINNNGGGIFSFLPIAAYPERFETCFGTPHGLGFSHAAGQFGLGYAQPDSLSAFRRAYRTAVRSGRSSVVEVITDRTANAATHKAIQQQVRAAVERVC
jgi:2-succinyl-5-enolpyruvyl-6-hydroxy-3-cyclohexene-1-carboxylate synthase